MVAGTAAAVKRKPVRRHEAPFVQPTSSVVISVGCKLPNGMHLDIRQAGMPVERITLLGTNSISRGALIRPATIGGFAVTENVPKEFFEEWLRLNKDHPAVKHGLIFAHRQTESVRDMGVEREELSTGLEPVDPNDMGAKNIKGVETLNESISF